MRKNIKKRRVAAPALALLLAVGLVALSPGSEAQATTDECDGYGVVGVFKAVESGASFAFSGRRVELQNESVFDRYSRAEIKSGRQAGDLVWVDRSYRTYRSFKGIVSDAGAESQGWKQCGPFSGSRTQSVYNDEYAARACARMDDVTLCGKWYVD